MGLYDVSGGVGLWDSRKAEGQIRELQISNLRFQKEAKIMKVEVRRRPALRCGVRFKPVTDRRAGLSGPRSGNLKLRI